MGFGSSFLSVLHWRKVDGKRANAACDVELIEWARYL